MKKAIAVALLCVATCMAQQYTKDGNFVLQKDYRQWVFLSSGLGMSYQDGAPGENPMFGNIFVNPVAYQDFLKTGTWPDKTILLIENRGSANKGSINKNGRFQTSYMGVEAHVKDSARGGWAFYAISEGAKDGKRFPKTASCYSCHEQNGAT